MRDHNGFVFMCSYVPTTSFTTRVIGVGISTWDSHFWSRQTEQATAPVSTNTAYAPGCSTLQGKQKQATTLNTLKFRTDSTKSPPQKNQKEKKKKTTAKTDQPNIPLHHPKQPIPQEDVQTGFECLNPTHLHHLIWQRIPG